MRKLFVLLLFVVFSAPVQITRAANQGILPYERQIVDSSVECLGVWDGDDEMIHSHCGPFTDHVMPPAGVMESVLTKGTATHNHPTPGCWTFSPGDLKFAAAAYLVENRVVARRQGIVTVSILRRTAGIWKIPDGEIDREARLQLKAMPADPTGCDYLDATYRALAARYGFEYEVISD